MFARRRRGGAGPAETPPASSRMGVHTETVLVADADVPSIHRMDVLDYQIGRTLATYSGTVIGYDRGDPARSLTEVMAPLSSPIQAIANTGTLRDAIATSPTPEFTDLPTSDPALDPYMAQLWMRAAR